MVGLMKLRVLPLALAFSFFCAACAGGNDARETPPASATEAAPVPSAVDPPKPPAVTELAVPALSLTVNHIAVGREELMEYPVYDVQMRDGSGVSYQGFALSDAFDIVGLFGDYDTVTATAASGETVTLTPEKTMAGTTLVALYRDNRRVETVPYLVDCESGLVLESLVSIEAEGAHTTRLPAAAPDPESVFGVDLNIHIGTIDEWLGRDGIAYRDVRMLLDPASYGDIGGDALLSQTIEGFQIVPYPYLASLPALPVEGAYSGDTLFTLTWDEDGNIDTVRTNYRESMIIMEALFPRDQPILLMCGGGGYAGMTKALLAYLGWEETLLYNVGGNWGYEGEHALTLSLKAVDAAEDEVILATWLADYKLIDFQFLHPIEGGAEIIRSYNEVIFPPLCFSVEF